MKFLDKLFIWTLALVLALAPSLALAQTATLLPNAIQQFVDANGAPLSGGQVFFYLPNTTTPNTVWQDSGEVTPWANPVPLNSSGYPGTTQIHGIYGNGNYRQIVKDQFNNIIWDANTASTGGGSGGGGTATVGDGDAVGTVKPWAGLLAPSAYVFTNGQTLARAAFPELLAAITLNLTVTCIQTNNTISGIPDTSNIPVGAPVESSCFAPGTTVSSTTISSITMSNPAIISASVAIRIFPFGNGDGSTSYNVPDLRGRVVAGRDNMGGVAANTLTSTFYGVSADALNAIGGAQSTTLVSGNLPPYTPAGTIANGAITDTVTGGVNGTASGPTGTGTGASIAMANAQAIVVSSSQASSTFTGTPAAGQNSTAFSRVQPSTTLNYIIKVTPDSNPNTFFGVASFGGMTGVITCGTGLICTGGQVSALTSVTNIQYGVTTASNSFGIPFNTSAGGVLNAIAPVNNGVVSFNGSGTPSASTTLPSGTAATNMALTTPVLGVAAGSSLALGGATIGTNSLVTPVLTSASNWVGVGVTPSGCGSSSFLFSVCDTTNTTVRFVIGNSSSATAFTFAQSGVQSIFAGLAGGSMLFEVGVNAGMTVDQNGGVNISGQFITATGSPTIASGACGTGTNGTIAGDNQSGVITIGASSTTACAVTFSKTIVAPKACLAFAANATAAGVTILPHIDTISATGFTLSGSVLASTKFNYHCY